MRDRLIQQMFKQVLEPINVFQITKLFFCVGHAIFRKSTTIFNRALRLKNIGLQGS